MDKIGPICRTAEDCAVVFNAIYGRDGRDNTVVDLPFNWDSSFDVSGLRVGYVEAEFSDSLESLDDRAKINKKHNDAVLDVLRSHGVELVPIELPICSEDMVYLILFTEAAAAFDFYQSGYERDGLHEKIFHVSFRFRCGLYSGKSHPPACYGGDGKGDGWD